MQIEPRINYVLHSVQSVFFHLDFTASQYYFTHFFYLFFLFWFYGLSRLFHSFFFIYFSCLGFTACQDYFTHFFYLLFFIWVLLPVKIISLILSQVNCEVGRKWEISKKNHLTTRKQNLACLTSIGTPRPIPWIRPRMYVRCTIMYKIAAFCSPEERASEYSSKTRLLVALKFSKLCFLQKFY